MICPNCMSKEISNMMNNEEIPDQLDLLKCHECSCIFLIIKFEGSENNEKVSK